LKGTASLSDSSLVHSILSLLLSTRRRARPKLL